MKASGPVDATLAEERVGGYSNAGFASRINPTLCCYSRPAVACTVAGAASNPRKSRRRRRFLTRSSNVVGSWRTCCLLRSTRTRRLRHFDELPSLYMIDIPVDRNRLRHQWVASNARDVVDYCLLRVFDSKPVDKLTFRRAGSFTDIAKSLGAELRGVEAFCQQIAHYFVGKELHSAVRVVNDEPLTRTEQLVRDHE